MVGGPSVTVISGTVVVAGAVGGEGLVVLAWSKLRKQRWKKGFTPGIVLPWMLAIVVSMHRFPVMLSIVMSPTTLLRKFLSTSSILQLSNHKLAKFAVLLKPPSILKIGLLPKRKFNAVLVVAVRRARLRSNLIWLFWIWNVWRFLKFRKRPGSRSVIWLFWTLIDARL